MFRINKSTHERFWNSTDWKADSDGEKRHNPLVTGAY